MGARTSFIVHQLEEGNLLWLMVRLYERGILDLDTLLTRAVLMIKRVLEEKGRKALLILPYVALVQEKVLWVRRVVDGLEYPSTSPQNDQDRLWRRRADENLVRVVGFFGGTKIRATWQDFDIAICTLEKANILINQAIDDCSISSLSAVVLDELHMVDDDHRGYILELIGAKILSLGQPIQIIGMSATMPVRDLIFYCLTTTDAT